MEVSVGRIVIVLIALWCAASEFAFRWNTRSSLGIEDTQRAEEMLKGIEGKRLTYRPTN